MTMVLVGGSGGLSQRYREVAQGRGFELRHYERKVPRGLLNAAGKIALVVVVVSMVSHPLREQAQRLADKDAARILYLRSASVRALEEALAHVPGARPPLAQARRHAA